ncbi:MULTISPECIES: SPOR domain-containing protein [unclassified Luteimonas]
MHLRALIVLLAVMNLGVALWWAARPAPEPTPLPELPADVPRLLLASEAGPDVLEAAALGAARVFDTRSTFAGAMADGMPAGEDDGAGALGGAGNDGRADDVGADDVAGNNVGAAGGADNDGRADAGDVDIAAAPALACFRLGPWQQEEQLAAASTALQPRVQRIVRREVPHDPSGWRVMLPPLADRDQAQAMVTRLEEAGFNDHFIVGQGDEANAIALGRFTAEDRARRHQAALGEAGFEVRVEPLGGSGPVLWLDVAAVQLDAESARAATQAAQATAINCAPLQ